MPARRELHDRFFLEAKREGYLARSAYKLLEIQKRHRIIAPGDRVLDLGCAPGSWLQVCAKIVGDRGVVLGVDLQDREHAFPPAVKWLRADAFSVDPRALTSAAGGEFDVVLSDMAPSTSGHGDDLLSARLCRRVLELARAVLRPGGNLAMKVLEGGEYPALLRETRALFQEVKGLKPEASRAVSREIFVIARGRRGEVSTA